MCVLNGRSDNDDFTCGASVVDYCIIPQEQMLLQWNFSVTRAREVFNQAGCDKVADNIMLRSVAVGKLEVRDRKSELPTCLWEQLGTFNSERVEK